MLVEDLRNPVEARSEARVILHDRALSVQTLLAVHGERTRVDHATDAEDARRLEAVVHTEDVEPNLGVRVVLAGAQSVGQVEHAVGLGQRHHLHHIVHQRDVAAPDLDVVAQAIERRRVRRDVHAVDFMPALQQAPYHPWTDEAAATQHQYAHAPSFPQHTAVGERRA